MNQKTIRRLVVLAVIALSGLMTVQIVWFKQAYDLQQRQFSEKANSALHFTANQLSNAQSLTPSVIQTSTNTFRVKVDACLNGDSLPLHLQRAFATYGTAGDYDVSVNDCNDKDKLLAYNFKAFASNKQLLSENITQNEPCYYLDVTFNDKPKTLMQEMWFWVFASVCCLLVLVFFAYSLYVLFKEKQLAEMKKDFINNMTHELKTPISNIAIASEMLKNPRLFKVDEAASLAKMRHYADIIQKENERLKGQVERVLTMAFLEEKTLDLKLESININELMETIITNFEPRMAQLNGSIGFNKQAKRPLIQADKLHLSNVIYSLLDNALKYSTAQPKITLRTENTSKGLRIAVTDAGIGMNNDVQKLIFDKFYRAPMGDVHTTKGFGLGLTYAKMIVEAHGGTINVESEVGKGSTFFIDLL
ncbi:MAG: HAMP domain-containing sensor histidine kinase [Saprospiraceae bacterium]|nr:HAMP domain-containing sensor histidine kinase [Saprospiraceae bacterium]